MINVFQPCLGKEELDEKTNQPLKESLGYEAAAVDIDAYKLIKQGELLEK